MIKVSIIIPVYNTEQYLRKCLESVRNQTLKEIEIICIDDGSTDTCPKILEDYARNDGRFRIIRKKNGGLISARKAGLVAASAEYVGWVDADDWIEPDYFEALLLEQQKSGADIIIADLYNDLGETSNRLRGDITPGLYRREEVVPSMLYTGEFFCQGLLPHMVTKLIRKDILQNVLSKVDNLISYGEDVAIFYGCVLEAETIQVTDICGYHYVQRSQSMAHIGYHDEQRRYHALISHLENLFQEYDIYAVMKFQLEAYKRYYIALRLVGFWDTPSMFLVPYGGIASGSKVVIYGAGVMGQHLYRYLAGIGEVEILAWLDRKFSYFQKIGLAVSAPECIQGIQEYDYILIAVTAQKAAASIRKSLLELNVLLTKIRWLSVDFLDMQNVRPELSVER